MTTYDDDHMRLNLTTVGQKPVVPIKRFGFEWPPPEYLIVKAGGMLEEATPEEIEAQTSGLMVRIRHSQITDEEREGMTHVARGAEYFYVEDVDAVVSD